MATVQYGSKLRHQSGGRLLEILCGIKGGFEGRTEAFAYRRYVNGTTAHLGFQTPTIKHLDLSFSSVSR
jgi:hypothetical protein